jgi:hypothetical protein
LELSEKSLLFIEKARKVHGDRYDYSLVDYKNNKTKVKIICKEHGVFEQRPDMHLHQQQGCPTCANKNVNINTYLERFKIVHGDRYDYSLVEYKDCDTLVNIICRIHGIFQQSPYNHSKGQNCPTCIGRNKTNEKIIKEFKEIHGDKYDYSLIDYENDKTKLKIICKIHGIFKKTYNQHKRNKGCPKCLNRNKTNLDIIEDFKKIHSDKYDYSLVDYTSNKNNVIIICKKHGKFLQSPNSHLMGRGCPICNESQGEKKISDILDNFQIKYIREYKINNSNNSLRLDFFIPQYNIGIEYNGRQHYEIVEKFGGKKEFLKTIERDKRKIKICEEKNIKLLIIPYKINKIEDIKNEIVDFLEKEKVSY